MLKRNAWIDPGEITIEMKRRYRYIDSIGDEMTSDDNRLLAVAKKIDAMFEAETFGRVYRVDERNGELTFHLHDLSAEATDRLVTELMKHVQLIVEKD